ncbi:hypothetical protein [Pseudocitrobacter vendiensis]|uniref:hypothetical protein n=1 Tax=Pseudocitrobacter vendiensis TaxID=2488306 RepID=UPI0020A5ED54|nr:hypothetical protein [Pseudocitrobacter vendiensis]
MNKISLEMHTISAESRKGKLLAGKMNATMQASGEQESRPGATIMAVITVSDVCFSPLNAVWVNYFKMLLCIT